MDVALSAGYKELASKIAMWSCIELRAEVNTDTTAPCRINFCVDRFEIFDFDAGNRSTFARMICTVAISLISDNPILEYVCSLLWKRHCIFSDHISSLFITETSIADERY